MKKLSFVLVYVFALCLISGCSSKTAKKPDITEIRSICNLATLECYYHNVAKSEKTAGSGLLNIGEKDRKFWIEYTGIAKIGIDMSKVDIKVNDDKVTVSMPEAKLLKIDISEKDLSEDSYITSGDSWFNKNPITAADQTVAIMNAQNTMAKSVENNSALLLNAQSRAQQLIESYIRQLGEISGTEYKIKWNYIKDKNITKE